MNPQTDRVFVSVHAKNRFVERFRKVFRRTLESTHPYNLIQAQISQGTVCTKWLQCPFYVNKQGSIHGKNIVVIWRKPCYYVCVLDEKKKNYIVKTVVPHWQGENRT